MESWERMKQAVAGRWTGKPDKTGITVLNPSESMISLNKSLSGRARHVAIDR